jgi:hypothetical protein
MNADKKEDHNRVKKRKTDPATLLLTRLGSAFLGERQRRTNHRGTETQRGKHRELNRVRAIRREEKN